MRQIALTDRTFEQVGDQWLGKCLICNGRLSFQDKNGYGANIEHIFPKVLGGTNELINLGLTHPGCNGEKGRNWDKPSRRNNASRNAAYEEIVKRLQARRQERWREPS